MARKRNTDSNTNTVSGCDSTNGIVIIEQVCMFGFGFDFDFAFAFALLWVALHS